MCCVSVPVLWKVWQRRFGNVLGYLRQCALEHSRTFCACGDVEPGVGKFGDIFLTIFGRVLSNILELRVRVVTWSLVLEGSGMFLEVFGGVSLIVLKVRACGGANN